MHSEGVRWGHAIRKPNEGPSGARAHQNRSQTGLRRFHHTPTAERAELPPSLPMHTEGRPRATPQHVALGQRPRPARPAPRPGAERLQARHPTGSPQPKTPA
eukprot:2647570-Alexandrium_andersonii.AAC.1